MNISTKRVHFLLIIGHITETGLKHGHEEVGLNEEKNSEMVHMSHGQAKLVKVQSSMLE